MLVECTDAFLDLETGNMREVGERFEVTAERLSAINSTKYGQLVKKVDEKPAETVSEPERPKARRQRKPKQTEE